MLEHFGNNRYLQIPMGWIVRLAIASVMRQEKVCWIRWSETDVQRRIVLVHDSKHPHEKDGND